jgi:hypothetical protein
MVAMTGCGKAAKPLLELSISTWEFYRIFASLVVVVGHKCALLIWLAVFRLVFWVCLVIVVSVEDLIL